MSKLYDRLLRIEDGSVRVIGNTMQVDSGNIDPYLDHLAQMVGPEGPDENTYFIGMIFNVRHC